AKDNELFKAIVKGAFMQRRKTLLNSLSSVPKINLSKDEITHALSTIGVEPTERCEKLSIEQFIALSDAISAERG
ncbi:MAG: 16S rRNA (adenine(1518)-N(6)/adenine(1519)-N(6))-dimethyltransferase, partial [Clostridia bacterium]|nr:16S rRNA (adenine(1518)-N(6)/adenine(1519)-N(6))-dimethyltransferase [Clostridia bacterium]